MYTTVLFHTLLFLAFVQWLRVSALIVVHGYWSMELGRRFVWWAIVLYLCLFLANLPRLVLPWICPHFFPLPVTPLPQDRLLALNKPREFWTAGKPCVGLSKTRYQQDGSVRLERTPSVDTSERISQPTRTGSSRSSSPDSKGTTTFSNETTVSSVTTADSAGDA
ncbi:uncharacterized protein PG986_003782 [Apiospora aurea]|uniref:Uncharacterized protein n=1 Tax=Apiospora aurea TaxID=335848 RepID=A0ABR1QSM9_9PEZI